MVTHDGPTTTLREKNWEIMLQYPINGLSHLSFLSKPDAINYFEGDKSNEKLQLLKKKKKCN